MHRGVFPVPPLTPQGLQKTSWDGGWTERESFGEDNNKRIGKDNGLREKIEREGQSNERGLSLLLAFSPRSTPVPVDL